MLFPEEEHLRAGRELGFTQSAVAWLVRYLRSSKLRRCLRSLIIVNRNASVVTPHEFEIPQLYAKFSHGSCSPLSENWMMYSSKTLIKCVQ